MQRFLHLRYPVLASLLLLAVPFVPGGRAGASVTATSVAKFCSAGDELYASPSYLAAHWPQLPSSPSRQQVDRAALQLELFESTPALSVAAQAPTAAYSRLFTALFTTESRQYLAIMSTNPYANSSAHISISSALVGQINAATSSLRTLWGQAATQLTSYCQGYVNHTILNSYAALLTDNAIFSSHGALGVQHLLNMATLYDHHVSVTTTRGSAAAVSGITYAIDSVHGMVTVCTNAPRNGSAIVVACP